MNPKPLEPLNISPEETALTGIVYGYIFAPSLTTDHQRTAEECRAQLADKTETVIDLNHYILTVRPAESAAEPFTENPFYGDTNAVLLRNYLHDRMRRHEEDQRPELEGCSRTLEGSLQQCRHTIDKKLTEAGGELTIPVDSFLVTWKRK